MPRDYYSAQLGQPHDGEYLSTERMFLSTSYTYESFLKFLIVFFTEMNIFIWGRAFTDRHRLFLENVSTRYNHNSKCDNLYKIIFNCIVRK